jgi:Ferritin-like domain
MNADHSLSELDRDGALQEAAARVSGHSRATVLAKAVVGTGALVALLAEPAEAALAANDVDVLNYALTLEFLQADFYTEAERAAALTGQAARAARVVGAVERAHVTAFRDLLGRRAIKKPAFNFRGTTEEQAAFLKTAVALEDLAVAAYKGQAPRLQSKAVLAAAVAIHSVEARHAAWMRHLVGIRPATSAFDLPKTRAEINRVVASTRFIAAAPRTRSREKPPFTG